MLATSSTDDAVTSRVVVVAGPTATGKSSLAVKIAREFSGVVINADSQQRYKDLPTLSARPTPQDMNGVPHKLFGDLGPEEIGSAAEWAQKAAAEINIAQAAEKLPVVVGGTGLYLRALMDGLNDIPPVPEDVRKDAEKLLAHIGNADLHERLKNSDPKTARDVKPSDTHRLLRAWTVFEATGKPLSEWRDVRPTPPLFAKYLSILILPAREDLYASCNSRFDGMIHGGAVEELKNFFATGGSPHASVMKMLGARELSQFLTGELTLDAAITAAKTSTRHYAKRQVTWFRHQFEADAQLDASPTEETAEIILAKIHQFLTT